MDIEQNIDHRGQGVNKFIHLMKNLTQQGIDLDSSLIQDSGHQFTIYSCLNSQQVASLFNSLHDQDQLLRITAAKFVCLLLHNNPKILELVGVAQGYQPSTSQRKYVVGGITSYQLNPMHLKRNYCIKQPEIVISMSKIGYDAGVIAWAIEIKTGKIAYFGADKNQLQQAFPFDPNHWVIGIFVGGNPDAQTQRKQKGKYKISRK